MVGKKTTKDKSDYLSQKTRDKYLAEIRKLTATENNETIVKEIKQLMSEKTNPIIEKVNVLDKKTSVIQVQTKIAKKRTRKISEEAREERLKALLDKREMEEERKFAFDFGFATAALGISAAFLSTDKIFFKLLIVSAGTFLLSIFAHFRKNLKVKKYTMRLQIIIILVCIILYIMIERGWIIW